MSWKCIGQPKTVKELKEMLADIPDDYEVKAIKRLGKEKGVLEQISEKQNSLLTTVKAWDNYIDKHGEIY